MAVVSRDYAGFADGAARLANNAWIVNFTNILALYSLAVRNVANYSPVVIENGRYVAPLTPGTGAEMLSSSVERYLYPDGPAWTEKV